MGMHTSGMVRNDVSHQHGSVPASASSARISKTWPPETELVMSPKNKVNISLQKPAIRVLLQDAIERVRASLLFEDTFPDANVALRVIRDCVIAAAERYMPCTSDIHERLKSNDEYLSRMASVVRIIFSIK